MKDLYSLFRFSLAGLRVLVAATLVLGVAYPLVVLGVAKVVAPTRAEGSFITADGSSTRDPEKSVGSSLIGQLAPADLFQPRPSAAGDGYDPLNTYGSNYGPESPDLIDSITTLRDEIADREGVVVTDVPPDAVTASASGLDPDISEEYAALQVARVAEANGLGEDVVRGLVAEATSGRALGVLGEPRVNVLELNVAVLQAAG